MSVVNMTASNSEQFEKIEEFKNSFVKDHVKQIDSISLFAGLVSFRVVRKEHWSNDSSLLIPKNPSEFKLVEEGNSKFLEFSYKWGDFIVPLQTSKLPKITFTTAFVEKPKEMTGQ